MKKLIYLMGTDGSGKTTLSQNLIQRFRKEGVSVDYLYARHVPILLVPFKLLSRLLLFRRHTQFDDYKSYSRIKSGFSRKHKLLARLYGAVWVLDYCLFIGPKIWFKILFSEFLVVDRYVGDVVVNIAVATGLSHTGMVKLLKFLHRFFPYPARTFFIQVDEQVAFQRKNDIPSVEYLRERREKYLALQDFYRFEKLDGHLSPPALLEEAYQKITQWSYDLQSN